MKKIILKKSPKNKFIYIGIFVAIILVTGFIAFTRKVAKPQDEVYVKIKLSQGLWWATSNNPPLWLAKSINPNDTEKDLFGNDIATVISRTYYPGDQVKYPNQYDVYLSLKLATKKDSGTNKYRYKRSTLAVGSPISIDLSSTTVTGAIMAISKEPIEDKFETKKIVLYDQYGYYIDSPTTFNNIKIGDTYNDGMNTSFKIVSKYLGPRIVAFSDVNGRSVINQLKVNQSTYVEAEIMVKELGGMYFYGEEQRVTPGSNLNILTNSQDFSRFTIVSIN